MSRPGRRTRVPFLPACALFLTLCAGRAGATPTNIILDNSPGQPRSHHDPMIRSLGDKVVAVWNDAQTLGSATEPRVHYAASTDSGATFTDLGGPPPLVNGAGTWRWRGDPQLALDPANSAFYMAALSTVSGQSGFSVLVVKATFSGPTLTWGTPVIVRHMTSGSIRAGLLAFESGSAGGSLHLLFLSDSAGTIDYQRSIDGNGAVWSARLALSSPAENGNVAYPRLAAGPGNVIHAAWTGPLGYGAQPLRVCTSSSLGASWGTTESPGIMRMNPAMPGGSQVNQATQHRTPYSMAVNRTAGSTTLGRLAFAWGESWDFSDEPFPALTGTVLRNEIEANDDPPSGTPFSIGEALQGTLVDDSDLDFWSVSLGAGDAIQLWGDSTATPPVQIFVCDSDGTNIANGFSGPATTAFTFRAPSAGTYGVLVRPWTVGLSNSFYRVRTRAGSPAPGEARDLRDIAVACSTASGWTVTRHAFGPSGYDDFLPTIGFAADGLDYVTWYDLGRGSIAGVSHLVVARNLAGADPVPSPPITVTDSESSWNDYVVIVPGLGSANDVSSDARRVLFAWTDLRNYSPDAFAASLATGAAPIAFPNDTTAAAGTTVTLHGRVLNRNPAFEEKVFIRVTGARSWPGSLVARDSVPAGSTGVISFPIAVPDTAAGPYTVIVTYERQSGIVLGSDPVTLTIPSSTGVGDLAPAARLEPISPNPTHGPARIAFALSRAGDARVEVFGIHGNRVRSLVRAMLPAGERTLRWDGRDDAGRTLPAGLYFVEVESAGFRAVRPVVLLK